MKKILCIFFILPIICTAQNSPRFENDTLYTSCGYKIYKGQILNFGKASGKKGKFTYVKIKNTVDPASLEGNHITVKEMKRFGTALHGYYIDIAGDIIFKDASKGYVELRLWFDQAIGNTTTILPELIVPKEFIAVNSLAIQNKPRFERDTLYTSCGYKIYKGLKLQFGKATRRGEFMYVNIKNDVPHMMLQNHSILVKELKDFGISALNNGYISIKGILMVKDSERGNIEIHMAFDRAIENLPGIPSELIVPAEFRNKLKIVPEQEVQRLYKLYQYDTISLQEFESHKKKLLGQ